MSTCSFTFSAICNCQPLRIHRNSTDFEISLITYCIILFSTFDSLYNATGIKIIISCVWFLVLDTYRYFIKHSVIPCLPLLPHPFLQIHAHARHFPASKTMYYYHNYINDLFTVSLHGSYTSVNLQTKKI